jgi:glycosyltransferase involved in cell wall biosynthesis
MNEVRFSILVHTVDTDASMFRETLQSICDLFYMNYEVIVLDSNPYSTIPTLIDEIMPRDGRLTYKKLSRVMNNSEAYNVGLRLIGGDYCLFLGQYDLLSPDILRRVEEHCVSTLIPDNKELDFDDLTKAASGNRLRQWKVTSPDLIYTDYDEIIDGTRMHPHFLGGFSPELLVQSYYFDQAFFVSMTLLRKTGFLNEDLYYGELYDYQLRMLEVYRKYKDIRHPSHNYRVEHLDGLMYHKRIRDIERTSDAIRKERYVALKTISERYMNRNRVAGRVVSDRAHQNWKWERRGADYALKKNDFLVLKDKDVKIQNYDKALEKMYAHLKQWDVAVVGGMFVHGSKILNCGYIYDKDGVIYPACAGQKVRDRGYEDRICLAQDVSMVDPGFCMIDEKIYRKLGGFRRGLLGRDAMLDFCLRVKNAGYRVVYEPGVVVNRNSSTPESSKESHDNLLNVYGPKGTSDKIRFEDGDEFYNQNLPLGVWNYSLFD